MPYKIQQLTVDIKSLMYINLLDKDLRQQHAGFGVREVVRDVGLALKVKCTFVNGTKCPASDFA